MTEDGDPRLEAGHFAETCGQGVGPTDPGGVKFLDLTLQFLTLFSGGGVLPRLQLGSGPGVLL